ncbi:transporter substrate-binding domain-containing protein [Pseudomonas chlororaphis]|uniref:substrate-binding periplasmic protein n=1 Tax=Pseudomonas chlororaphis TaxID=587753 RepID=UPI001E49E1BB|nr:transporter substrate-binding domain-containing protein [Pseudomonas chlororaphis]MCB2255288.1 transporter substrate-binding domain-containing protein [Pseudomonas chlororaphis]
MRSAWGALLLVTMEGVAAEPPLRFSIADSWAMPVVQIERGRPTQGILHDMLASLATQVGRPAEFHVLARARVQAAMDHKEIDIRCYAAKSWLADQPGDYLWSVPLFVQRDLLVAREHLPITPRDLSPQPIGTVLSYTYPSLQPLFDSHQLLRDDARNQEQVLQKLWAGRYRYAVSNQWTLDWFNQTLPADQQLHGVAVLQEQAVGCIIRNDPALPVQRVLRTLLRMKMSGEIDDLIGLYTGRRPTEDPSLSYETP